MLECKCNELYLYEFNPDDVSSVIGLQGALKFNGGGHLNHSIFWQVCDCVYYVFYVCLTMCALSYL